MGYRLPGVRESWMTYMSDGIEDPPFPAEEFPAIWPDGQGGLSFIKAEKDMLTRLVNSPTACCFDVLPTVQLPNGLYFTTFFFDQQDCCRWSVVSADENGLEHAVVFCHRPIQPGHPENEKGHTHAWIAERSGLEAFVKRAIAESRLFYGTRKLELEGAEDILSPAEKIYLVALQNKHRQPVAI